MFNRSINKVILVGNLGKDPEMRYMPNGNAVANFSIEPLKAGKTSKPVNTRTKLNGIT